MHIDQSVELGKYFKDPCDGGDDTAPHAAIEPVGYALTTSSRKAITVCVVEFAST